MALHSGNEKAIGNGTEYWKNTKLKINFCYLLGFIGIKLCVMHRRRTKGVLYGIFFALPMTTYLGIAIH